MTRDEAEALIRREPGVCVASEGKVYVHQRDFTDRWSWALGMWVPAALEPGEYTRVGDPVAAKAWWQSPWRHGQFWMRNWPCPTWPHGAEIEPGPAWVLHATPNTTPNQAPPNGNK